MTLTKFRQVLLLSAVLTTVAACSGGSNDNRGNNNDPQDPTPPPQSQTDFTGFVIDLFGRTADNTDPEPVNDVDFIFADQDNPAAFDEQLE